MLFCIPILLAMPETCNSKTYSSNASLHSHESCRQPEVSNDEDLTASFVPPSSEPNFQTGLENEETLASLLWKRSFFLALTILLIGTLQPASLSVLLQYASARFGLRISEAAMLLSEVAIVNIVLFLFVLPHVIAFVTSRWHIRSQVIDWIIVQFSLLILALGALLIGSAPSIQVLLPGMLNLQTGPEYNPDAYFDKL